MGKDDSKMVEMISGDVPLSLAFARGRLAGICIANFVHVMRHGWRLYSGDLARIWKR